MKWNTYYFQIMIILYILSGIAGLPGKLLKVPKIYNALITTKEKLLPSEAYPATTGPIFQPIAFTGEPILLNANDFINSANQQEVWRKAMQSDHEDDEKSSDSGKEPSPLVFYPRYGVYYPHHTVVSYVNTLQHSFVYTAVDHSKGGVKTPLPRPDGDRGMSVDDYIDDPSYRMEATYSKNNRPSKIGVPDVPPPPLPVGYTPEDQEKDKEVR